MDSPAIYTCDICGHTETGYDLGLEEAEMYMCQRGHIFCQKHKEIGSFEDKKLLTNYLEELLEADPENKDFNELLAVVRENNFEDAIEKEPVLLEYLDEIKMDGISSTLCPFCNFDMITDFDLIRFFLLMYNKDREEAARQAKVIYGTVDKLYEVWNIKEKGRKRDKRT